MNPEKAKQQTAEQQQRIKSEFNALVNMTVEEMRSHFATEDAEFASVSPKLSKRSGRLLGKKALALKLKDDWTDDDYALAKSIISPLRMQLARKMPLIGGEDESPTRYTVALRNRGHDPLKNVISESVELSMDRRREIINHAVRDFFWAIFPDEDPERRAYPWCREIYDQSGRAIVEYDGGLYELRYTVVDGDVVIIPDLTEVEMTYVPVSESFDSPRGEVLEIIEAEGENGPTWRAIMIRAGAAKNLAPNGKRRFYSADVLRTAVAEGVFSNVPAYQRTDEQHTKNGSKAEPVGEVLDGYWQEAVWDEDLQAVVNDFIWVKDRYPSQFDKKIRVALAEGNEEDLPNCSITGSVRVDNAAPHIPLRITEIRSCDWISYASAGGTLIAISESHNTTKEHTMKTSVVKVLESQGLKVPDTLKKQWANETIAEADEAAAWMLEKLKEKRPKMFEKNASLEKDLAGNQALLVVVFEEFMEAEKASAEPVKEPASAEQQPAAQAVQQSESDDTKLAESVTKLQKQFADLQRTSAIKAMNLTPAEEKLAEAFMNGKEFSAETLQAAVTEAKETLSSVTEGQGARTVKVSKDETDKFKTMVNDFFMYDIRDSKTRQEIAESSNITLSPHAGRAIQPSRLFERITGVRAEDAYSHQSYLSLSEAMDSTLATAILVSGMNTRMVYEFNQSPLYKTWRNVSRIGSKFNFKTNEAIGLGGFSGYATVAKGGTYPTITESGATKETYAIIKRGGIFSIALEDIRNDDIDRIVGYPRDLGRYGARMLSAYIWALVTANPTLSDSIAVFHASHSNLLTDALSATTLATAIGYLQAQTEPNSTDVLATIPKYLVTSINPTQQKTAYELTENAYGTNNAVATWAQNLGIRPTVNPHTSDVTDWYLFADPNEIPILEVSFLDGREDPEIQQAQTNGVGEWFSSHQAQFRIFHAYNGSWVSYKGAVAGIVAD